MSDTIDLVRRLYDIGKRDFFVNIWRYKGGPPRSFWFSDAHSTRESAETARLKQHPFGYYVPYRLRIQLKVRP